MNKNTFTSHLLSGKKVRPFYKKPGNTRIQQHHDMTWVDLENPTREDLSRFADQYHLHPLQVEECFAKGQLPQVEVEKEYLFLLLYFPKYIDAENRIAASHVGIFLGKNFLITVHEEATSAISSLFDTYEHNPDHDGTTRPKNSPGHILYAITSNLLNDLSSMVYAISQGLDEIEGQVFDNNGSDAYQIGQLRQKIVRLRRIATPLQDILGDLSLGVTNFTGENMTRQYSNSRKIAKKLWEAVEEAKETVEIYKDADFTTSTERTNNILSVLTLLFTLTIPATVVGTFYGMNILLPGGIEAGPWTFLGRYTTLVMIITGSTLPVSLMLWYFRKKRWF